MDTTSSTKSTPKSFCRCGKGFVHDGAALAKHVAKCNAKHQEVVEHQDVQQLGVQHQVNVKAKKQRRLGKGAPPLLKAEMQEAMKKSDSAMGAAKLLGLHYTTYKTYARKFGILEDLKKTAGVNGVAFGHHNFKNDATDASSASSMGNVLRNGGAVVAGAGNSSSSNGSNGSNSSYNSTSSSSASSASSMGIVLGNVGAVVGGVGSSNSSSSPSLSNRSNVNHREFTVAKKIIRGSQDGNHAKCEQQDEAIKKKKTPLGENVTSSSSSSSSSANEGKSVVQVASIGEQKEDNNGNKEATLDQEEKEKERMLYEEYQQQKQSMNEEYQQKKQVFAKKRKREEAKANLDDEIARLTKKYRDEYE